VPVVELELSSMAGTIAFLYGTGTYYIKIFSKHSWSETGYSNGEFTDISLGWNAVHFCVTVCYLLLCP
jgi:hypothetical protein